MTCAIINQQDRNLLDYINRNYNTLGTTTATDDTSKDNASKESVVKELVTVTHHAGNTTTKQVEDSDYTLRILANLRLLYEESAEGKGKPLSNTNEDTDILDNIHKLAEFINAQHKQVKPRISLDNISAKLQELSSRVSWAKVTDRADIIAAVFSEVVTAMEMNNTSGKSRLEILQGYTENGKLVGGTEQILQEVRNQFQLRIQCNTGAKKEYIDGATSRTEAEVRTETIECLEILRDFDSLALMALSKIKDRESIIMDFNSTNIADESNYSPFDIESLHDVEEATREAWQEAAESLSAFASLGALVRRVLASIKDPSKKSPILAGNRQSKGTLYYLDPVEAHQLLQEVLVGCTTREEMIHSLHNALFNSELKSDHEKDIIQSVLNVLDPQAVKPLIERIIKKAILNGDIKRKNGQTLNWETLNWEQLLPEEKLKILNTIEVENYIKVLKHKDSSKTTAMQDNFRRSIEAYKKQLTNAAVLQTSFLNDLRKNFTPLMAISKSKKSKIKGAKHLEILNEKTGFSFLSKLYKAWAKIGNSSKKGDNFNERLKNNFEDIVRALKSAHEEISTGPWSRKNVNDRNEAIGKCYSALIQLGFDISPECVIRILTTVKHRKVLESNLNIIIETLEKKNILTGINSSSSLYSIFNFKDNRYGTLRGALLKVSDIIAKNTPEKYESRVPYIDKKGNPNTLSSHLNPSYLGDTIDKIKSFIKMEDIDGLKEYLEDTYFTCPIYATKGSDGKYIIHNKWLEALYNSKLSDLDSFAQNIGYFRLMGNTKSNGSTRFEDYLEDAHLNSMLLAFTSLMSDNSKSKFAHYPVFVLGDSGVSKYITAPKYTVADIIGKDQSTNQSTGGFMYEVFLQELTRMELFHEVNTELRRNGHKPIDNTTDKDGNIKYQFTMLPFLNKDYQIEIDSAGKAQIFKIIDKDTNTKRQATPLDIISTIRQEMAEGFEKFSSVLEETLTKEGGIYNESLSEVIEALSAPTKDELQNNIIKGFYYNYRFAMIQQMQILTVDVGYYANVKDLQKRFKEVHAPGTPLDVTAYDIYNGKLYSEDGMETVVYFDDISLDSEELHKDFMSVLKNSGISKDRLDAYKKNTLTDGQGYRTLESYRKVMGMAGKWNNAMEEAYNTIKAIRESDKLDDTDIKTLETLNVVFQPLKPYNFSHEKYTTESERTLHIPVQHKYAEVVLIPELLPEGSKLRALAEAMEEHGIDMVGSTKICKVGCFGAVNFSTITKNGQEENVTTADLAGILSKAYKHKIKYSDFRIQTNVPEHVHHSTLFGTQIRKLILAGLDKAKNYGSRYLSVYNGQQSSTDKIKLLSSVQNELTSEIPISDFNGNHLVQFYNQLICANIFDSIDKFIGSIDDADNISKQLIKNILLNNREARDNILAYCLTEDDKFLVPLFEGNLEHDSSAALLSLFKKMVNKQKIAGGSAVQCSAWGINKLEDESKHPDDGGLKFVVDTTNNNVLYAECEIPFNLSYKTLGGKEVKIEFNDYCNPDGSLKLTDKYINVQTGEVSTLEQHGPGWVRQAKIEEDFPGILDIIAYRIPTESKYSMLNLRVTHFSKPTEGGTIKVPAQGTTIAGFDFDIDKLYLMRKEFKEAKPHWERYNLTQQDWQAVIEFCEERDDLKDFLIKVPEKIEELYDNDQRHAIWKHVYDTHSRLYLVLKMLKRDLHVSDKTSLNSLMEKYPQTIVSQLKLSTDKNITKEDALELVKKYKNKIFTDAASELQEIPLVNVAQEGYTTFNKEALAARTESPKSVGDLVQMWANNIGRNLVENTTPRWQDYDMSKPPTSIETTTTENGETVTNVIQGNNRVGRNNMLIHLIRQRLMDPETMKSRYTPGGFNESSKAARILRELQFNDNINLTDAKANANNKNKKDPEPEYDYSDPLTLVIYNQQNQIAGKLIGTFANQNVNHAYSQLLDTFKIKDSIKFGDHMKDGLSDLKSDAGLATSAEFLAASVDAVKDPVLNFLELNTVTATAGAMLARIGYSPLEIGLLFNQPIIKDVVREMLSKKQDIAEAIVSVTNKWNKNNEVKVKSTPELFSSESLAANISKYNTAKRNGQNIMEASNQDYIHAQLDILENLFLPIYTTAQDVNSFISATKFTASNSVKSTIGDMYAQKLKIQEYLDKVKDTENFGLDILTSPVAGAQRLFITDEDSNIENLEKDRTAYIAKIASHPFAYEQLMFDANKLAVKTLCERFFPYETESYKAVRKEAIDRSLSTPNGKLINSLHTEFTQFMLSQLQDSKFNVNTPISRVKVFGKEQLQQEGKNLEEITILKYYREYFPLLLVEYISTIGTFNSFLDDIDFDNIDEDHVGIKVKSMNMQAHQIDKLRDSFLELFENDHSQIAEDLYFYNYIMSGYEYGPKSFGNLIPNRMKEELTIYTAEKNGETVTLKYGEFLQYILESKVICSNPNAFIDEYCEKHPTERKLVYQFNSYNPYYKNLTELLKNSTVKFLENKNAIIDWEHPSNYTFTISKPTQNTNNSDGSQQGDLYNLFILKEQAVTLANGMQSNKVQYKKYVNITNTSGESFLFKCTDVVDGIATYTLTPTRDHYSYNNNSNTKIQGITSDYLNLEEEYVDTETLTEYRAPVETHDNSEELAEEILFENMPELRDYYDKNPDGRLAGILNRIKLQTETRCSATNELIC